MQKEIHLIWAETANGYIGKNGDLAWRDPTDLKQFKELTTGSVVVMGRKTAESLSRPLPNRVNVVLSNVESLDISSDYVILKSVQDVLNQYDSFWVIGGKAILEAFMPFASEIRQTVFTDINVDGDVNAPEIPDDWMKIDSFRVHKNLTFNYYERSPIYEI